MISKTPLHSITLTSIKILLLKHVLLLLMPWGDQKEIAKKLEKNKMFDFYKLL